MAPTRRTGSPGFRPGRLLFFVLTRVGLPLALLYALAWWRIDAAINTQVEALSAVAEVQRGRTFFNHRGEVGFAGFSLAPRAAGLESTRLRADRVVLQTPGLWWLLKASVLGLPERLPRNLGLRLHNFEAEGLPQAQEAGIVGVFSAMPFEAAGCNVGAFSRSDLRQLGLPDSDTVLSLQVEHSEAGIVNFAVDLGAQGVGQMQWRMGLSMPAASGMRADALVHAQLVNLSLTFIDQGFIAARNGWCMDRVTTSLADFNREHTEAVRRQLRTIGLQPDADLLAAYARFAADGGEFRVETRPSGATGLLQLAAMDGDALRQALAPYVRSTGSEPVRFAFARVTPMSLRDQQVAAQVAKARLEDGVPLDPVLEEVVSDPPRIPVPRPTPPQIPLPASDGSIAYADLAPYIGREIEVRTLWGSRRRGTLVDYAQARMLLRLPAAQGGFDLTVPAETVLEVRILDAASIQPDSATDLTDAQAN
jgi:hypothetical protein